MERKTYTKIPGVDQERILHIFANSHKLAQNDGTLPCIILGNNEFHARRVHAISQGRDNSQVGNT